MCVCDAVCNVPFCLLSSVVSGTSQNVRVRIMTGCGNHTNFLKPFEMCMHTYDACQPYFFFLHVIEDIAFDMPVSRIFEKKNSTRKVGEGEKIDNFKVVLITIRLQE